VLEIVFHFSCNFSQRIGRRKNFYCQVGRALKKFFRFDTQESKAVFMNEGNIGRVANVRAQTKAGRRVVNIAEPFLFDECRKRTNQAHSNFTMLSASGAHDNQVSFPQFIALPILR
jgi:hypothetical protein